MGRITQIISYINSEQHPTPQEIKHLYSHLTIDEHTKELRRKYKNQTDFKNNETVNKIVNN